MKKKVCTVLVASILVFSLATAVFAATWFESWITLPRTGGVWSTVERLATSGQQATRVREGNNGIFGRILIVPSGLVTPWTWHPANQNTTAEHTTSVALGTALRGQFRTAEWEIRLTSAFLAWRP